MALSRPKQGFDSPMGHMLPHAFTAWGSLHFSLETAAARLLNWLYAALPAPLLLKDNKGRKSPRNAEIKARYAAGTSVPQLATDYDISKERVYQILSGRRR